MISPLLSLLACADTAVDTLDDWLEIRISASDDDAEEDTDGVINMDSSDLELTTEDTAQTVGLRFAQISLPGGATVLEATVQFEVDEISPFPTFLSLKGQLDPAPLAFSEATDDLSRRARTNETVTWDPDVWATPGAAGAEQRTPDLAPLLQELIDQPGWVRHNPVVLLITGTGTRTAKSFDGDPEGAALLRVLWEE